MTTQSQSQNMLQNTSTLSRSELTPDEQFIYNAFLIASRKAKNKPFRLRTDFSKISDEVYITLKKLNSFFQNYKNIQYNDFFWAPYEVYSKEEYFDLDFYKTRKAMIAYTQYMHKRETQDPDSDSCIEESKNAIKNIYYYCVQHASTLSKYKQSNFPVPACLIHLKSHVINFYVLHGLDVEKSIKSIEPELLDFYKKDFYDMYYKTRTKFVTSQRLKNVIREGLKIIEKKLLTFENHKP